MGFLNVCKQLNLTSSTYNVRSYNSFWYDVILKTELFFFTSKNIIFLRRNLERLKSSRRLHIVLCCYPPAAKNDPPRAQSFTSLRADLCQNIH